MSRYSRGHVIKSFADRRTKDFYELARPNAFHRTRGREPCANSSTLTSRRRSQISRCRRVIGFIDWSEIEPDNTLSRSTTNGVSVFASPTEMPLMWESRIIIEESCP